MNAPLLRPRTPPPPLDAPQGAALARLLSALRMARRAGDDMLELFHPEMADRRWHAQQVGPERLITVNDPGLARHVLTANAANYVKAPLYHALLGDVIGPTSSLLVEGEASRARRRLLAPAFNARALRRVEQVIAAEIEAALPLWTSRGEVDLTREIPAFAMRVAMRAFFSTSLGDKAARLGPLLDRILMAAGTPSVADILDLPRWVPRRSRRALRSWLADFDALLYDVIDARTGEADPDREPDLLDALIGARDAETGAALGRKDLRDEVVTLFLAGHETTALSLIWGLDRLAREPDALAALTTATRAGDPPRTAELARAVPGLAAAYEEMLRLYPPAFAIARQALGPDRFESLDILPGDRLQIAIFMLHRNPRFWPDPHRFDPARFDAPPAHGAFLPFGAGPRICIGLAMARMEAQMLIATLLARCDIAPVGAPPEPLGKITLRTRAPVRLRLTCCV